jgi:hypothetical protein
MKEASIMAGGVQEELVALHSRRAQAENEMRERLYGWAMEHCEQQTFGAIRQLADEMRDVITRLASDVYNLPHSKR